MSHLPLVPLEDKHKSQGQAHRSQSHKQHSRPVVAQGKQLAGGVDIGPHHHVEDLQGARGGHSQEYEPNLKGPPLDILPPSWAPTGLRVK